MTDLTIAQTDPTIAKKGKTRISKGNIKIGNNTWNINLPPHKTCQKRACFKEECCYNFKAWRMFPSVRMAWDSNWNHYNEDKTQFFDDIILSLTRAKNPPKWFRWQAAGEIPDQEYFEGMKRVAVAFPEIKFLVFTKKYDLYFYNIPKNLNIVISAWPGMEIPRRLKRRFPIAWMIDGRETRKPKNGFECPGHCPECRACWSLSKGKDVIFHRH